MIRIQNSTKPDIIGATVSGLCALHCMVTPFIFVAKAASVHVHKPLWWGLIDYVFIIVSFLAIYQTVKNTSRNWMKYALWTVWFILLGGILNETFEIRHLPEAAVYVPALVLAGLHLYNKKYCKCDDDNCCAVDEAD